MWLGRDENIRQVVNLARENVAIHGGTGTGKSYRAQQLVEGWSGPVVALGVEPTLEFQPEATVLRRLHVGQVEADPSGAIAAIVATVAHRGGHTPLIVVEATDWSDKGVVSALVAALGTGARVLAVGQTLPNEITEAVDCMVETRPGFEVDLTRH